MKYRFIKVEKVFYPVILLCRVLGVSRSGFYKFMSHEGRQKTARDLDSTKIIRQVFLDSRKTYGSPRVYQELKVMGKKYHDIK